MNKNSFNDFDGPQSNFDETEIEFGDLDQTLVDSAGTRPIIIELVDGEPVPTVQIESAIDPQAENGPRLGEIIAFTFLEMNKLGLPGGDVVHIVPGQREIPLAIACVVMKQLMSKFETVKVYCADSNNFETVSI